MSMMFDEKYYNEVFMNVVHELGDELSRETGFIPEIVKGQVDYIKTKLNEVEKVVNKAMKNEMNEDMYLTLDDSDKMLLNCLRM